MSTTYILEDLQPDSSYEVYVQARNFYGTGAPTTRIVFRTASKTVVDLTKTGKLKYRTLVTLSFYHYEQSKNKHLLILLSSLASNSQEPKLKRIFEIP